MTPAARPDWSARIRRALAGKRLYERYPSLPWQSCDPLRYASTRKLMRTDRGGGMADRAILMVDAKRP